PYPESFSLTQTIPYEYPVPLIETRHSGRILPTRGTTRSTQIIAKVGQAYWSDQNKVKFEMGLCRGKDLRDKRDDIQKREGKREADRMIKNFNFDSTNTLTIKDYSLWMVHSKAL
ncbi:hypothetical protein HJC23_012835, partial [Cyclotella cryptica]